MSRHMKWTDEEAGRLHRLHRSGVSIPEMREQFPGRSDGSLLTRLVRDGLIKRAQTSPVRTIRTVNGKSKKVRDALYKGARYNDPYPAIDAWKERS